MRYHKLVQPKPHKAESRAICDSCRQPIEERGSYDATEVRIRADIGACYPECDNRITEEVDCCADCWRDKVVPALKELGFTVYEHSTDAGREMLPDPE